MERNYECLLDFDQQKKDYWQQQRLKEEEEIKKINFDQYITRQQLQLQRG